MAACRGRDTGPQQDHSILASHGGAGLMVEDQGRDTGPQPEHSILASHGGAGLMVEDQGRDTGPQPEHSILQSHGSAGLMAACRGRDTYSGALRKGDIMCCQAKNVISHWMEHCCTATMLQYSCDRAFCNIVAVQLCSIQSEMTFFCLTTHDVTFSQNY